MQPDFQQYFDCTQDGYHELVSLEPISDSSLPSLTWVIKLLFTKTYKKRLALQSKESTCFCLSNAKSVAFMGM